MHTDGSRNCDRGIDKDVLFAYLAMKVRPLPVQGLYVDEWITRKRNKAAKDWCLEAESWISVWLKANDMRRSSTHIMGLRNLFLRHIKGIDTHGTHTVESSADEEADPKTA